MDGGILNRNGASLLEVTAVVFVIGVLLSMLIPGYRGRFNEANLEKTIIELSTLAQASVDYYIVQGAWPEGVGQLAPQFMPHAVTSSPFGTIYQISGVHNMVTAAVLIPAGLARKHPQGQLLMITRQGAQDQIAITKMVPNALTARLSYALKHSS